MYTRSRIYLCTILYVYIRVLTTCVRLAFPHRARVLLYMYRYNNTANSDDRLKPRLPLLTRNRFSPFFPFQFHVSNTLERL